MNSKYNHWVITNINDRFLIYTTENAPNGNVVLANIDSTQKNNWKIVIPESDMAIHNVSVGGRKLFVQYIKDSRMHCFQYSYDGILEHEITLPGTGSIDGFWGKESESNIFYTFQSFFHPESIWKYNIKTGISKVVHIPSNAPNPITYQETKITYGSKDGTKIPMLILHKKGQQISNNICWLEGYGGFNASLLPKFNPSFILFIDQGGVIALPSLRGGGEYGKNWHEAGTLHKKQNVFDDFIAASEYMIHSGYTSTEKLIISGVCNGGLLVSACANQRPDLYAVVITDMGIMDMIRYQNFSIGNLWISEYGTSDDPSYFRVLYAYSPLHNIKNIDYPSIMVRTSDNDGRVPPLHSFKYVAQLQKTYQGLNPILLRVYSQSGHGCHLAIQKKIDKMSDFFAFAFYNTKTNWKV